MVSFMENPNLKWMRTREFRDNYPYFRKQPHCLQCKIAKLRYPAKNHGEILSLNLSSKVYLGTYHRIDCEISSPSLYRCYIYICRLNLLLSTNLARELRHHIAIICNIFHTTMLQYINHTYDVGFMPHAARNCWF